MTNSFLPAHEHADQRASPSFRKIKTAMIPTEHFTLAHGLNGTHRPS
jgi:hypothetical protein